MASTQYPSDTDEKAMAIAPKISSIVSFIASMFVLVSFYRSPVKKKKMYHRLVVTMSSYGVVQSIVFFTGTWAFPPETPHTFMPNGNVYSCIIQGILTQWTMAIPLYYTSLSIYCYVAIKEDFQNEKIAWIEPWIHFLIHLYLIISVIIPLVTKNINPNGPVCWIQSYPRSCGRDNDLPCIRGDGKRAHLYLLILGGAPIFVMLGIILFTMFSIYRIQKQKDTSRHLGKLKILAKAKKIRSTIAARQASMFTMAFIISYSLNFAHNFMMNIHGSINYALWIAGATALPLQNVVFSLVYFWIQGQPTDIRFGFEKSYTARLKERLQEKTEGDTKTSGEESSDQHETGRRSYTIFDGTVTSSSPWSAFLIDDSADESGSKSGDDHA